MIWKDDISLEILNYSHSHINSKIQEVGSSCEWMLTGFYGQPETNRRLDSWALLGRLKLASDLGWCVLRDFNEIVTQDKRMGGRPRLGKQMEDFKVALERNGLVDLGWKNQKYTLSNWHNDDTFTKEH